MQDDLHRVPTSVHIPKKVRNAYPTWLQCFGKAGFTIGSRSVNAGAETHPSASLKANYKMHLIPSSSQ